MWYNGKWVGKTDKDQENELDEIPVFYCSKCMSLNIIATPAKNGVGVLSCADCGKGPKYIDVTNIWRWMRLYERRTGHHPLEDNPTPYDDLREAYDEEAQQTLTSGEAFECGLHVRDVINKRWED